MSSSLRIPVDTSVRRAALVSESELNSVDAGEEGVDEAVDGSESVTMSEGGEAVFFFFSLGEVLRRFACRSALASSISLRLRVGWIQR